MFLFQLFFWAVQIFVAKLGLNAGAGPVLFNFQSYLFALIFLSIYGLFAGTWQDLRVLSKKALIALILANAIVTLFGGVLFNAGAKLTTAINIGFLSQFTVVATILLAWFILKEKIDWSKGITVLMILTGTFLLTTEGKLISPHIGDIFLLISCVAWATSNVLIRKSLKNTTVPSDVASLLKPIVGLPILLFVMAFSGIYPEPLKTFFDVNLLQTNYVWYAVSNGVLLTLLWIFINRSLKVASASYSSIFASMTPVLVAILAIVFLRESMSGIQIVGALIIVVSGYVAHYLKFQEH